MMTIFRRAFGALIDAQERRARERILRDLDERMLRDIGLETHANLARDRAHLSSLRLGMF